MHVIRTLLPNEFDLLKEHLLRLDAEDRFRRFAGHSDDATVARHVEQIDHFRTTVVAWIEDGRLRGAAELMRLNTPAAERGEIAVTVEKDRQDQGIGTELLRRALTIARNRGIEQILMVCLPENGKMRHLADKFRGKLIDLGGEMEAKVDLVAPDGLSLLQEAVDLGQSAVDAMLAQWSPRRPRSQKIRSPALPRPRGRCAPTPAASAPARTGRARR